MSSRASRRRSNFTEINITPLTDIFLVLLIIMMVIAPMLDTQGLKLAVPTVGQSSAVQQEPKVLMLSIGKDGAFQLNQQPVSAAGLQGAITRLKGQYPEGLVIQPHPDAPYGQTVVAMDAARSAGVTKMAVSEDQP